MKYFRRTHDEPNFACFSNTVAIRKRGKHKASSANVMPNSVSRTLVLGALIIAFGSGYPLDAASGKAVFELDGKIFTSEKQIFRSAFLSVSLHSTDSSFSIRTLADGSGKFKF